MESLLVELERLTRRRPTRLLCVGLDAGASLQAEEIRVFDRLPADQGGEEPFDMVVWRHEEAVPESDLAALPGLMAERSRLVLVVDSMRRASTILNLSRRGFAVHDERSLPDLSLHLVVARATDFIVRAYEEGDEHDILRLFKPSFHVERSLAHWRWKFEQHPFGSRQITIARDPEGRLAAHYAGYPVTFSQFEKVAGKRSGTEEHRWTALQIGDTMTLPEMRTVGRGPTSLLGRCVRHFFAMYCEGRIAFNFGFNTGNIQKFSRRFVKAETVEDVGYWIRPPGFPADASRSYRIVRPKQVDRSWDRFFEQVGPHYGLLVRRDARWIRWRYLQCPDDPPFLVLAARRWGRLVGWGVFRRRGNRMRWCDALFDPRHVEASWSLLRTAMEDPSMEGVEELEAWFPSRPEWWRRQLVALGFEPAAEPDSLALMVSPFVRKDAAAWLRSLYYTMGDGDLA